ncbi:MAG: nuclear transport factor 2 family protein [Pseudomonadota bacterium]
MMTIRPFRLIFSLLAMAGAAGAGLAASAAHASDPGEAEQNRRTIARSFEAWRDGTGGPYDLLAQDAVWTITGHSLAGKTYQSRDAFMNEVIRPFNARMRERLIPTVHAIYAENETVIIHFDARGVARDGKPYENSYAWLLRLKGGKITRAHAFFDALAFDDLWRRVPAASD